MKKSIIVFSFLALFFSSLFSEKNKFREENNQGEIHSYCESLSDVEKISQLFLVNVEGNSRYRPVEFLDDGTALVPGGVLLFSYNIGDSAEQLMGFTDSIFEFCQSNGITNPYVAVDQEGGEVRRLHNITSNLPSCKKVADNFSVKESAQIYGLQGQQMKLLGIQMNLAPVAEVQIDYNRDFLSRRSFGSAPRAIAYSVGCINAYENAGIASVAKHFPGNSNTDPHVGLPVISIDKDEFDRYFLLPFSMVVKSNPSCILMSHAIVVGEGQNSPACLSSYWIQTVLKDQLGYEGLVISDDIFMGALANNGFPPDDAVVLAIESGVDILMLSEKKFLHSVELLIEKSKKDAELAGKINSSVEKILALKLKLGLLKLDDSKDNRIVNENRFLDVSRDERMKQFKNLKKEAQRYER